MEGGSQNIHHLAQEITHELIRRHQDGGWTDDEEQMWKQLVKLVLTSKEFDV